MRHLPFTLLSLLLAAGLWIAGAVPVLAHEDAVLEVTRSAIAPGDSLLLDGSDFGEGGEYRLRLVGTLDEHDLGKVRADSAGRFRITVLVPADVAEGRYQLVAVAGDGDEVARAEVRVTRGKGQRISRNDGDGTSAERREPRTAEMDLPRERTGVEWALIGLLLGGAGGLGLVLLRLGGPA